MAEITLVRIYPLAAYAAVYSCCLSRQRLPQVHGAALFVGTGELKPPGVRIFEKPRERLHDAPGRPSSSDLIKREAERRVKAGTASRLLKTFASELSAWLRDNHPDLPQITSRAVENVVRNIWRQT